MYKRTTKKLLSLLMALCLLLTSLPGSALEINAVNAEQTNDAVFQLDADCQILDYVHEEVFNGNNHIARLKDEETLDTYVFLNNDGTKTVYYMNDAVKYRDSSGTVREKNINLTAGLTGYSTTQNDVQLNIPNNISNGVQLSYAGYDVSIVPQGGSSRSLSPQRNGNSVAYTNYYGSGTALIYTPTLNGVKEDILLAKYNGVSEFTFLLNTDGLNLYHTPEDRYYLALTAEAEMKIWLGNIEIFDAEAKPSMGTVTVETVTAGQQYRLTISADVDFLTDPNTVYPVTIDPTITVSDNNNGANAIEDAPIYEGYPTSNFGTYQYNRVGYAGSAYKRARTVVRLTSLIHNSTFLSAALADIQSVNFYIADASGTTASSVYLYAMPHSSWSESNITWNNAGSFDNSDLFSTTSIGNGSYASFNITELAKAWKNESYDSGENGFILVGYSESSVDRSLYSCEHSTTSMRPYVVATYGSNPFYSDYSSADYYRNTRTEQMIDGHWFDDGLQFRANCYGYAFRFFMADNMATDNTVSETEAYKQIPGEFADKSNGLTIESTTMYDHEDLVSFYTSHVYNLAKSDSYRLNCLIQLMQADADTLGYSLIRYTGTTIPDANLYHDRRLIAVVIGEKDYHFYMQHSDNTWSHKPGNAAPKNTSIDSKVLLTNSNIKTAAKEGEYNKGLAFFYITKNAVVDYRHNNGSHDSSVKTVLANTDLAGDSTKTAKDLGTVSTTNFPGNIDYLGDVDYLSFIPSSTKAYNIRLTPTNSSAFKITLLNAAGSILNSAQTNSSGSIGFTQTLYASNYYYLVVSRNLASDDAVQYNKNIQYTVSLS